MAQIEQQIETGPAVKLSHEVEDVHTSTASDHRRIFEDERDGNGRLNVKGMGSAVVKTRSIERRRKIEITRERLPCLVPPGDVIAHPRGSDFGKMVRQIA
jgi:hypothetical protein